MKASQTKLAEMQARREGEHFEIFTLAPPPPPPTNTLLLSLFLTVHRQNFWRWQLVSYSWKWGDSDLWLREDPRENSPLQDVKTKGGWAGEEGNTWSKESVEGER